MTFGVVRLDQNGFNQGHPFKYVCVFPCLQLFSMDLSRSLWLPSRWRRSSLCLITSLKSVLMRQNLSRKYADLTLSVLKRLVGNLPINIYSIYRLNMFYPSLLRLSFMFSRHMVQHLEWNQQVCSHYKCKC